MERIVVRGGRRLSGDVYIGGSKNAALPVLFGGILTGGVCVFSNLPRVSDVLDTLEILKFLGARICFLQSGEVRVDYSTVAAGAPPATLTGGIRGSTYLLGAMLGRFGRAELLGAGGCDFGTRPIDQHLMGFERLGATVTCHEDRVTVEAPRGLHGAVIPLKMPSVGATANLMMAASLAEGGTILPVVASGETDFTAQIIVPIVSNGDCLGAILLLSKESGEKMDNNDLNLARLTAEILANQFE